MEFNRKILVLAHSEDEAEILLKQFKRAGILDVQLETARTNVVPKLQDKSIEAIIVSMPLSFKECERIVTTIKGNRLASLVPMVIYAPGLVRAEIDQLYELGVNHVIYKNDLPSLKESCQIIESLLTLIGLYKVGNLERFTR
jgi:hypothetical protein